MYKIMVIDDEKIICKSIKSKIERIKNPYISEIFVAFSGEEAIKLASEIHMDIIMVDIKMPDKTGIEVIEYISNNSMKTRFMVLSGYDDYHYVREAFKLGVYDYLLKPISIIDLKERLEAVLNSIQKNDDYLVNDEKFEQPLNDDSSKSIIDIAVKFINNNYEKNISLAEVSDMVSMNYSYFSHLFKQETGKTFSQYLTQIRMEQSVKLLYDPLKKIGEISNQVGYSNPYHFSRSFKAYYGIPPKQYRNKLVNDQN